MTSEFQFQILKHLLNKQWHMLEVQLQTPKLNTYKTKSILKPRVYSLQRRLSCMDQVTEENIRISYILKEFLGAKHEF
jgi:hypothetical protein